MKQYCTNCHNWRPLDDSFEIGACFQESELPLVRRFRFKHEIWSCWKVGKGAKVIYPVEIKLFDEPEPQPVQVEIKAVEAEVRHELNGQVTKAYWYVRKLARAARMNQTVGA